MSVESIRVGYKNIRYEGQRWWVGGTTRYSWDETVQMRVDMPSQQQHIQKPNWVEPPRGHGGAAVMILETASLWRSL